MTTSFQSELRSFNKRLEILNTNLDMMKKLGVDEDLLVCYLCHKLKISQKNAKEILACIQTFYDKLFKRGLAKTITQNNKPETKNDNL